MAGHQVSKKGKRLPEPSGAPAVVNQGNAPIKIANQDCILIIESNIIPGTTLQRATCDGRQCVAISKGLQEAYDMHNTLSKCDHPNILKSIGVWTDPRDESKAYIVLLSVDTALSCLKKEQLFCVKNDSLCGLSEFGFKVFLELFSAVQYINNKYIGEATSSASNNPIQLFSLMLDPNNIFINFQGHIMLGNFQSKLSETTRKHIEAAHWKEVGNSLNSIRGTFKISAELNELLVFLTEKAVTYDDLLWQPGIWDATTKMEFIREIFWLLDQQREDKNKGSFESTPRGKVLMNMSSLGLLELMNMFSPPKNRNGEDLKIKDDHLLDSVVFLRNKIVAHYDDEYPKFKGPKNEIGTTKERVERYVQTKSADYMIKLAKAIRGLRWIAESPVKRDKNDYMKPFYKMIEEESKAKEKKKMTLKLQNPSKLWPGAHGSPQ